MFRPRLDTVPPAGTRPRSRALIRGLLAAILLTAAVFVLQRELGRHFPVEQWLVWPLLGVWAYALVFVAACWMVGNAIYCGVGARRGGLPAERLLVTFVLGLVAFVFGLYFLGAVGCFLPWAAIALPVGLILVGAPALVLTHHELLASWRAHSPPSLLQSIARYSAVACTAVCVSLLVLQACSLEAINFDAAWYHLPTAQDYAREGRLVPFPGEAQRAFPHLTSMLQTWALLVPGLDLPWRWILTLHLEVAIVLGRMLGMVAVAEWMLEDQRKPGLWPVFFLFPTMFVYDQAIGGSADHVVGFFAAPILLGIGRFLPRFEWRHGLFLGVAVGGAMLSKYQAVYLTVATVLVLGVAWSVAVARRLVAALRGRHGSPLLPTWRVLLLAPVLVLTATAVTSAPHFGKNAVFYGNPVYPFAQALFPRTWPASERYVFLSKPGRGAFAPQGSGAARVWWATTKILKYPFQPANRDATRGLPYSGALFVLLLPLAPLVRRPKRILIGTAVALIAFYVWANTSANDRYALAFATIPTAIAASLIVRVWELGWAARVPLVVLVALESFWAGGVILHHGRGNLSEALAVVNAGYQGKGTQRFGRFATQRALAKSLPVNARILARNYRTLLGLDRMVLSDEESAQAAFQYADMRDARDLWDTCQKYGVTHLLYPEGQRRPHSWAATVLFADLARQGSVEQRLGGLVVVRLPSQPPPHRAPFLVYVRGAAEYEDGLYAVEQLNVYDRLPRQLWPRPLPRERSAGAAEVQLIAKAHALALVGRDHTNEADAVLARDFVLFERFGNAQVYLRR